MTKKVFISYSSRQLKFAKRIKKDLEKNGFELWLDTVNLKSTILWTEDLTRAIVESDYFLLLWSFDAKESEHVQQEITTARVFLKPIIPVLVQGEKASLELPEKIAFLQIIVSEKYKESFKELLNRLSEYENEKIEYPRISYRNLYIPHNRKKNFIGRQAELVKLFVDLYGFMGKKTDNYPCVISGLTGIGKTELAIEFSYRYNIIFPNGIFWVDASKNDLTSEFIQIADRLNFKHESAESKQVFVKRVIRHLQNLPESLLILDGISNLQIFRDWCPKGAQSCAVLITSSLKLEGESVKSLYLTELDETSALQLLASHRPDMLQNTEETKAAKQICRLFVNFPAALELFASHLAIMKILSAKKLLAQLNQVSPLTATPTQLYGFNQERQKLFSLFTQEYEKLDREKIDPYLFLMSAFSIKTSINYFEFIEDAFGNSTVASEAIQHLYNISFFNYDDQKRIKLHDLVVAFAQELQFDKRVVYEKKFVEIMVKFMQDNNSAEHIDAVLSEAIHIEHAIQTAERLIAKKLYDPAHAATADILESLGRIYYYQHNLDRYGDILSQTLQIRNTAYEKPHASTGNTLHDFGSYYLLKGEYENAIEYFKRALEISRVVFGEKHTEYLERSITLANAYSQKSGYKEALDLLRQTETLLNIVFDNKPHLLIARMWLNMSEVQRRLGNFKEALRCSTRSEEMSEKIYSQLHSTIVDDLEASSRIYSHPRVLNETKKALRKTLLTIADTLEASSRIYSHLYLLNEAKSALRKTLLIRRKVHGNKHLIVGNTLFEFGMYRMREGKYMRAIKCFEKALHINKFILGENHPDSIDRQVVIASAYRQIGNNEKASQILKQVENLFLSHFRNTNHPIIARAFQEMSHVWRRKGNLKEAERYIDESINIKKNIYEEKHPSIAESLQTKAKLQIQLWQYESAKLTMKSSLSIRIAKYGDKHPEVANALNELGCIYIATGEYLEALKKQIEAYKIKRKYFGTSHPELGKIHMDIGIAYRNLGKFHQAMKCLELANKINRRLLGTSHPYVARVVTEIGITLSQKKYYETAITMLTSALEIYNQHETQNLRDWAESLENLALIFIEKALPDDALNYLERAFIKKQIFYSKNHPDMAKTLYLEAKAYKLREEKDKVKQKLEAAMQICNETFATESTIGKDIRMALQNS